jgi:hypothetical protein
MCRTYGAWDFRASVTQASRPGLNCVAPTALGGLWAGVPARQFSKRLADSHGEQTAGGAK